MSEPSLHLPIPSPRHRARRQAARALIAVVVAAVTAALLPAFPALAAPAPPAPPVPKGRSVPVHAVTTHYRKPPVMPAWHPASVAWPSGAGDAVLAASTSRAPVTPPAVRAGNLPVWFTPTASSSAGARTLTPGSGSAPGSVHVQVTPRQATTAAGIDGVLLAVSRGDGVTQPGPVHVSLSYSSFADAYGGDWASRLTLVQLPACAATTPKLPACRTRTPLRFQNNAATKTLSADLVLPASPQATMLAAVSADSSGAGDFTATSLKASGSWSAGGSSDGFDWSYPIPVPQVPGGLAPTVTLSYSSQSVDGLTSGSNNQASWIGDGWDYSPGYIERSYQSCHQNPSGSTKTWDNCWSSDNQLTLSLNGSNSLLVKDDTTGTYHPENDANEKVSYLTGASNGAQNGEYFQITTDDGTRYIFGLNHLPGWTSGQTATNSVWTEPVFATASGQPCYNATFANSWCQQAYRWNLDEIIDTHGDTIAYFYTTESNYYARDLGSTANTAYTRGGYLSKITYGQHDGSQYTTSPAAQVIFTTNGRCDTSGTGCDPSTLSSSSATHWPDVPYDLNCAQNASCTSQSPTFWSEDELTSIQTQVLVGSTETPVDTWALHHSFPATGETADKAQTAPSLWLDSITLTGQDTTAGGTTAITLPAINFSGTPLANRVDINDGYPAITRHRLNTITTETGETISVDYSQAICPSCAPSDQSTNTTLSYPAYWTRPGQTDPTVDWFNKYIVTHVTEQDGLDDASGSKGGAPPGSNDTIVTTYTPVGLPAWHHNDNPLTPSNQRTWDQWRGYSGMTVSTGTAPDPITKTTYTYLRGMDGDTLPSGERHVSVPDSRGDPAIADLNQYAGMTLETIQFNGPDIVTDTVTDPWTSAATATHTLSGGLPSQQSFHTGQADTKTFTPLASGTTRETETDNSHDGYGRVVKVDDMGDTSTTNDDLCTTTSYADNTTLGILDAPDEVKTVSVNCATTNPPTSATVSDQLTFYDGSTILGTAPTVGDTTMTKQVASYTGDTPNYVTTSTTVDQYGRTLTATDANNHTTTTAYTPTAGAAPATVTVTDPVGLKTITNYDPLRNLPTKITDPAGYITSEQYDALGRLITVYKPGRAAPSNPNLKFSYTVSADSPSVVNSYTLNEDLTSYRVSETLYDSLLRAREVQTQTPDGSRIITDTNYNTDGWVSTSTAPYHNGGAVSPIYVEANAGDIDSETAYLYDGAGRKTDEIAEALGTETWRTSYIYGGNFVTTLPPEGATATTSVTDARGRQTDLIQYKAGVPTDYLNDPPTDYTDTTYTYTPAGQQAGMKDPAGNSWTSGYNLLGQLIDSTDPDTGHTVSTYDGVGNLITTTNVTDGNKQTTYTYDKDNRKTGSYDTTTTQTLSTGNAIAGWTYDTVKPGLPASTTSYSNGDVYTYKVLAYGLFEKPAATNITLTGTDAGLVPTGGYTTTYGYTNTGLLQGQTDPAEGGLPNESITYGFDTFGEPTSVKSASWTYVSAVGYDYFGKPAQYTMPTVGGTVTATLSYDSQTQNLTGIRTTDTTFSGDVDNLTYTYGNNTISKGTGLITKIVDKRNAATSTDTQCATYDYAERLTQAWTATDDCTVTPQPGNSATVGGTISPYWQSWTYDDNSGLRTTQTDHDTTGNTANDTTTTYHYPTAGSSTDQPHTLSNTTSTGPAAAANTATYTYDLSGNTKSITGGSLGDQTMTWTNQGKLATDQTAAGTTGYVYDADDNLLVRRDPGSKTLYLGDTQLVQTGTTITGTRYYTIGGSTIAARSSTGAVTCLIPDQQGTTQLAITTDASQTVTRRQYLPFGQTRGTPAAFPGDKGYVGGNADPTTGLENLGAREYNPVIGRFLSADPVLETTDPDQVNGYDYAANNPITSSDPTGLCVRLDDLSGPCAETANTTAGKARLKDIENDRRRQQANWRQYERKQAIIRLIQQDQQTRKVLATHSGATNPHYATTCSYGSTICDPTQSTCQTDPSSNACSTGMLMLSIIGLLGGPEDEEGGLGGDEVSPDLADPAGGADPVVPRPNPAGLRDSELDTLDRLQAIFPEEGLVGVNRGSADFVNKDGVEFDAMGAPGASKNWGRQRNNFLDQIPRHALKSDFAVVDLTGFTPQQIAEVTGYSSTLSPDIQNKLIIINGTQILN